MESRLALLNLVRPYDSTVIRMPTATSLSFTAAVRLETAASKQAAAVEEGRGISQPACGSQLEVFLRILFLNTLEHGLIRR